MQPCMNATVPRRTGARVALTFGSCRTAASGEAGGASDRIDFRRAVGASGASFGASLDPGTSARSRAGCVNSAKIALRYARSRHDRASERSSCGRVRSISLSYYTPDGLVQHLLRSALDPLVSCWIWALFTPPVLWLAARFPLDRRRWLRNGLVHLGAAAVSVLGLRVTPLALVLLSLVVLVGWTRIWLRAHTLGQVIAGGAVGATVMFATLVLLS